MSPLVLATLLNAAFMAPPESITVQGALRSAGGQAVDGPYQVSIAIYDDADDGNLLWPASGVPFGTTLQVQNGVFETALPNVAPAVFAVSDEVWLGIVVAGQDALPRAPIRSVPMALMSTSALGLACTDCLIDGSLTAGTLRATSELVVAGTIRTTSGTLTVCSGNACDPAALSAASVTVGHLVDADDATFGLDPSGDSSLARLAVTEQLDLKAQPVTGLVFQRSEGPPVACAAATRGFVYYDTGLEDFRGCAATGWVDLDPPGAYPWSQLSGLPPGFADQTDDIGIGGSGTPGHLARFDAAGSVTSSNVFEANGNIGIADTAPVTARLVVNGDVDISGNILKGERYLARYALAIYIDPGQAARVGTGLGGNYGLLACFPSTSDIEPSVGDEQITGFSFDIGGSGSPSSCMAGAPNLGNDPCARLEFQDTRRTSHDAYGVVCHHPSNGSLTFFGYDFQTDAYVGSGGHTDSGIAELPTTVGQMVCTTNGYACVQRIR